MEAGSFHNETVHSDGSVAEEGSASAIMVAQLVICVLGVIANLTVISVILILRDYRKTVTHWYVLQLAIADCAFLLTIPFSFVEEQYGSWIYSNGMCKAKETLLFLNYHSSILFLVVMSLDRYIAVCHARSIMQSKLRNRWASIVVTASVWVLSLMFCIPIMLYSKKSPSSHGKCICANAFPRNHEPACSDPFFSNSTLDECIEFISNHVEHMLKQCNDEQGDTLYPFDYDDYNDSSSAYFGSSSSGDGDTGPLQITCNYNTEGPGWFAYLRFLFVGMFIIPLIIMMFCYTSIIRQLNRTKIRQSTIMSSNDSKATGSKPFISRRKMSASSEKANKKIEKVNITCIILVSTFVICWLPFHSYHIAMTYGIDQSEHYCKGLLDAASMLVYINSLLNPFVYSIIGTKFKERLGRAAGSMKSSVRRSSTSASRGTVVRYNQRRSNSRTSSRGVTLDTTANKSMSSSNGPRSGANWSMVAMPGSTADP